MLFVTHYKYCNITCSNLGYHSQVGEDGAGHYVKMVHNGIEYGDMQLICEAYQLMKDGLGMSTDEMSEVCGLHNPPSHFPSLFLPSC